MSYEIKSVVKTMDLYNFILIYMSFHLLMELFIGCRNKL